MSTAVEARPRPRHTVGHVVAAFFKRRLRHVQGPLAGTPVMLEPWQQDDLDLIYEVDDQGRRVWQSVLYGLPRGNGKTPLVGGISLLELVSQYDAPRVFAAAGARDQARLLLEFMRPQTETPMPLADHLIPRANAILAPKHRGVARVLSADGHLAHGLSVSFAGVDELHVMNTERQKELVFALETALKRPHSWSMSITTAGKDKRTLLGQRYEAMLRKSRDVWTSRDGTLTIARDPDSRALMIWRGLPEGADMADERIWRAVNPGSWVDLGYLRAQAHRLPRGVFARLHLNAWMEGSYAAIPGGMWDACADPAAAELEVGAEAWVALAMSEKTDSGVLCLVGRPIDGDGRRPVQFVQITAREDGRSVNDEAAQAVRDAAMRWRIRSFAYNPQHFAQEAAELGLEGLELYRREGATDPGFREIGETLAPASREILAAIAEGHLAHDGADWVRDQITAADTVVTSGAWRIARPRHKERSDLDSDQAQPRAEAAMALMIAWAVANGPANPYETGDLRVI